MASQLRFTAFASLSLAITALALVGCGGGGGGGMDGGHDSGSADSGPHPDGAPVDSGPGVDSGGHDSGPGGDGGSGMCPSGACDLAHSTGCMAGQACQYLLTSPDASIPSPVCQPAGTGMSGAHCTMPTDCAEGLTCDTGTMTCRHYCCALGTASVCPTGQMCNISITAGTPPTETGVGLCSNADDGCNVLMMTGCTTTGYACYPANGGATQCAPAGTLAAGAACMFLNDCMPGYSCVGPASGSSTCHQVCSTGDGGTGGSCASGMMCGAVTGFPTGLGVCG